MIAVKMLDNSSYILLLKVCREWSNFRGNTVSTKFKSNHQLVCHPLGGAVCAGLVLLIASSAPAQNLFVSEYYANSIREITPSGEKSTFGTGLLDSVGLAFNSAGDLFVADQGSGSIYEFTPGGTKRTFASGLSGPHGLAFNSAGDLFEADLGSGNIYEFTPDYLNGETPVTFASGLDNPQSLAFQGVILPVPEPSVLGLLAVGVPALLIRRQRKRAG